MTTSLNQFKSLQEINHWGNRFINIYSYTGAYLPSKLEKLKPFTNSIEIDEDDDLASYKFTDYCYMQIKHLPIIFNTYLEYATENILSNYDDFDDGDIEDLFPDLCFQLIQMDIILNGTGEHTLNAIKSKIDILRQEPDANTDILDYIESYTYTNNDPTMHYDNNHILCLELNHL